MGNGLYIASADNGSRSKRRDSGNRRPLDTIHVPLTAALKRVVTTRAVPDGFYFLQDANMNTLFAILIHCAALLLGSPAQQPYFLAGDTLLAQLPPSLVAGATSQSNSDGEESADGKDKPAKDDEARQASKEEEAAQQDKTKAAQVESLRKAISQVEKQLNVAQKASDEAHTERETMSNKLQQTLARNTTKTVQTWEQVSAAEKKYNAARETVRTIQQRLSELQSELAGLQDQRVAAFKTSRNADAAGEEGADSRDGFEHPFTLASLVGWLSAHGPKLLAILIGTFLLSFVIRIAGRHLAEAVARGTSRGTAQDRKNRAVTLVGVFRNTASIALFTGGGLMMLDAVDIPIAPLMGGAAVFGLAIAFGAQNLIRDYFSGFMVLLEDQYGVGDVVKIGDIAGSVERITLRMTVLRDLEGAVHFVPHGSITVVTNMTHGWSRALIDVGIAYKEDADRVMAVLMDIGKELRDDPTYGPLILDGPEMLGLDSLDDSAVVLKFYLKTQPTQRWYVKRELLRRIKQRFDALGIEIPFPQRTVHYAKVTTDDDSPPAE